MRTASSSRNGRGRIGVAVPGGFRVFSGGCGHGQALVRSAERLVVADGVAGGLELETELVVIYRAYVLDV